MNVYPMWDFPHRAWPPVKLQSFAHYYNGPTPSDSSRSDRDMGRGIVGQITFWSAILNAPHAPLLSKSRAFGRRCGLQVYSYSRPCRDLAAQPLSPSGPGGCPDLMISLCFRFLSPSW